MTPVTQNPEPAAPTSQGSNDDKVEIIKTSSGYDRAVMTDEDIFAGKVEFLNAAFRPRNSEVSLIN